MFHHMILCGASIARAACRRPRPVNQQRETSSLRHCAKEASACHPFQNEVNALHKRVNVFGFDGYEGSYAELVAPQLAVWLDVQDAAGPQGKSQARGVDRGVEINGGDYAGPVLGPGHKGSGDRRTLRPVVRLCSRGGRACGCPSQPAVAVEPFNLLIQGYQGGAGRGMANRFPRPPVCSQRLLGPLAEAAHSFACLDKVIVKVGDAVIVLNSFSAAGLYQFVDGSQTV